MKNVHLLDDWTFVHGVGDVEAKAACVMSAYAFLMGQEFNDRPLGVDVAVRSFCIAVNDTLDECSLQQQFAYGVLSYIGQTRDESHQATAYELLAITESDSLFRQLVIDFEKQTQMYHHDHQGASSGDLGCTVANIINKMPEVLKVKSMQILVQLFREVCEELRDVEIKRGKKMNKQNANFMKKIQQVTS